MPTHIQHQALADAISGNNTETYSEPSVDFKEYRLIVHTSMVYGSILAYKMGFSEDRLGTVEDFKLLNFK